MVDPSVVKIIRSYLTRLRDGGIPARFAVLFGSEADGSGGKDTDIDLIVVSPRFDGEGTRDDINLLWRAAARVDSRIEPIPCGERQWIEDDAIPVLEAARREGVTIPADK